MNSNINFLFALLILVVFASLALMLRSCGTPVHPEAFPASVTLEDAIERSRQSGRPVLAFFTADWCGRCQSFKRGALASSRTVRWVEANAEPVYIDATRANAGDTEMLALLTRYRVTSFPTLIMLEPGRPLDQRGRLEGDVRRRELVDWFESMKR